MPEVGIYDGEPNAFATGAFRNSALVAVSTGLLRLMNKKEIEAVLAHEMTHVANGDMVTMTLIQGVVNTFVVFISRIIGWVVDRNILRNEDDAPGMGYYLTSWILLSDSWPVSSLQPSAATVNSVPMPEPSALWVAQSP